MTPQDASAPEKGAQATQANHNTEMQNAPNDLIGLSEVAEILQVSTTSVVRWTDQGHLVAEMTTPGGYRRYRRECVHEFLESLRDKARNISVSTSHEKQNDTQEAGEEA